MVNYWQHLSSCSVFLISYLIPFEVYYINYNKDKTPKYPLVSNNYLIDIFFNK